MTVDAAVSLIRDELSRAEGLFPAGFHSGHEGYAVIREEVDELWDAVKHDDGLTYGFKAMQVAAMALRFLVELVDETELRAFLLGRQKREATWRAIAK